MRAVVRRERLRSRETEQHRLQWEACQSCRCVSSLMILAPLIWLQQVPDVFGRGLVIQVLGCVPAEIRSRMKWWGQRRRKSRRRRGGSGRVVRRVSWSEPESVEQSVHSAARLLSQQSDASLHLPVRDRTTTNNQSQCRISASLLQRNYFSTVHQLSTPQIFRVLCVCFCVRGCAEVAKLCAFCT